MTTLPPGGIDGRTSRHIRSTLPAFTSRTRCDGIALERDENSTLFAAPDRVEGLAAFAGKHPAVFSGSA